MTTPDQDAEHLRLLTIFHYVLGGLQAVVACIPIIHVVMGVVLMVAPQWMDNGRGNAGPPAWFGLIFVVVGGTIILLGWTMAVSNWLAGRNLARRRRHMFCTVVAGINCLWMPVGTALGVFTILVLMRPAVKASFS